MKAAKLVIALFLALSLFSCKEKNDVKRAFKSLPTSIYNGKLAYGSINRIDSFPSKFVRPRTVDVWLPENYSEDKKYAVLYMHDGQMLFDSTTTWNKQEWKVDEIVGRLQQQNKIKNTIVVAIWNHSDIRHTDYYPQKPFALLPQKFKDSILETGTKQFGTDFKGLQSDNYLKFIVEEVKPYIDTHFSVETNLENTVIAGSSMGGLISMYALCEYPDIFGSAACLSTHWIGFMPQENSPVPESFFTYLEQKLPSSKNHKIYFDYGTETLDKYYLPYQQRVDEVLKLKGYTEENSKNIKFEGHDHSENSWNKRFQIPVQFLLKKELIMKNIKILLLFLSVSFSLSAQNIDRQFVSALKKNGSVEIKTNDGLYKFQPYGNEIIETTFIPKGEKFIETSHAVVLKPSLVDIQLINGKNKTEIKMKDISVVVEHVPFQISYFYEGNFLISEKNGYYKAAHEPMDLVNGNIVADETERIEFNLTQDEVLYGGGARALGMNRRGNKLPLFNKAHYGYETHSELMNFTLPVVYSSKMYSIHFDNATVGYLDLDSKKDNTLTYETVSGRKTYQVIAGDDWEELVENYVNLTGKQPLPPRWAFGNFSSRFGYHTQKETLATINIFLEEGIPVDAIILDLYWFGEEVQGTMGNLDFYKKNFPNPEEMIAELNDKGVKTILITEPFILTTSSKWEETSKNNLLGTDKDGKPLTYDFYFGNTGLLDIFKPEAEDWFWNVYKKHNNMGVAGWWGDLGEPEVHPAEMIHAIGTADEVHNIYGHYWAKLIFDGYKKDFPHQRPFILMRAGYAGSQHYGMIPWTGDVNRTWGGLKPQVEISLQMGMQGLAYMHSDLGGFAGANLDDELYARWLQYGVFQPIYRPHAQEEVPSEPVFREGKTKQLAKEAIKLRYRLLPYNYTLAFENSQNGKPLMRPIFFEDTSKKELFNYKDTYFWGDNFLISPVVNKGATSRKVYFPANNNWYNFYTNEKVEGGQTKDIKLVTESIPTYVRGGAIIPMVTAVQNTELYNLSNVDVHFYYDESVKSSTAKLYSDDGIIPSAYDEGKFELTYFSSEVSSENITISIQTELGEHFNFETKNLVFKIHNIKKKPSQVNGYNYNWNETSEVLEIEVPLVTKNNKTIQIKL